MSAAEPADDQIKGALDDVARIEQQLSASAAINAATARRTLRLLDLTRERLEASPNKSHPSFLEANRRLDELTQRLQAAANGAAAASLNTAAPQPTSPAATSSQTPSAAMISQQRVRIQRLVRDIASATSNLDQNGPKPFQSGEYVAKQQATLDRFEQTLDAFSSFASDPDVIAANEAIAVFQNMIAFGIDHAKNELQAMGDPQEQLRRIEAHASAPPAAPEPPYPQGAIHQWVVAIATARQTAENAITALHGIRQRAYLPNNVETVQQGAPYDMQDVDRLHSVYQRYIATIDESLESFKANIDTQAEHAGHTAKRVESLNPQSSINQANAFLGRGAASRNRQALSVDAQLLTEATSFDKLLNRETLPRKQELLQRVTNAQAEFEAKHKRAMELVRLPEAASTNNELIRIAEDALQNPSYEVGPIKRLVINTEKTSHEMETSETEFDKIDLSLSGNVTLTGTKTTYKYAWEQFQVATAEAVGDTHFIYYNTLKRYSAGAPTTPINRWIIAQRIESCEIPEANIKLD